MNQNPPNGPQIPLDNQQQPQWQPQSMPGLQQPQPQYASMQPEGAPMPAQIPTQPTPTLEAMYSQGRQSYDQPGGQHQYQQDFAQQPHDFPASQQMPQDPQMRSQQQQAPFATPFDQGMYTGQDLQNQQYPHEAVPPVRQENQGTQYPAFNPAASAWEQEHVTEVNDGSPFTDFPQQGGPQKSQNQAARDAELLSRRQRVQALDEERVRQETLQVIAISARDAPDLEELEEQLQQQIHQAQLLSLDAWEQEIRRQIEQQGQANQPNAAYDDSAYPQMGAGMGQQGSAFSDPRGGYSLYSPTPTLQGHHAAQQAQYHPAASYAGPSQAASGIHQADFGHPAAPNISQAQSVHGGPTQMPPPMGMRAPSVAGFAPMHNPAASSVNLGFSSPPPPSQTPTRGVPMADAARNLTSEDQRRWDGFEAYQQRQPGQQGGGATPSEYTVRTSYDDGSEANTKQYGSKGKGRMV